MPTYTQILPDGTRQEVSYKLTEGPVSTYLKLLKELRWLQGKPQFANSKRIHKVKRLLKMERRKLDQTRRNVAQNKSRPRSAGTKGRSQTNMRNTNPRALAGNGGEASQRGNPQTFTGNNTAAPSLQTGCELMPQGCLPVVPAPTAVGLMTRA